MTAAASVEGRGGGRRGGTLWRVRDRATMSALVRQRRARSGPVTVALVLGLPSEPPRVAYSVGRRLGGAVTRNRIRRRLRAAVADVAGGHGLAAGAYLVGATSAEAATLPFPVLRDHVAVALEAAAAGARR